MPPLFKLKLEPLHLQTITHVSVPVTILLLFLVFLEQPLPTTHQ